MDDPEEYHRVAKVSNPYGDGKSSERIVRTIIEWSNQRIENVYARSAKEDNTLIPSSTNTGL